MNSVTRVPYSKLAFHWQDDAHLSISAPWINLEFEIDAKEKPWIKEATDFAHSDPTHASVQKLLDQLKKFPIFYTLPRPETAFDGEELETTLFPLDHVDFSTPKSCINTLRMDFDEALLNDLPDTWLWSADEILEHAHIAGTDLYDPLTVNTYLPLIRLAHARNGWEGSGGIYNILEEALENDEARFFTYMGWTARQSHYLTSNAENIIENGIKNFPVLRRDLQEYLADETGHHKFLTEVLDKLEFTVDDFELNAAIKFFVASLCGMADRSALAYINLIDFSEAYAYEEKDPLSELLKKSSKPNAGDGYQKHYQINFGHDHDMIAYAFCSKLGPQRKEDCLLAIRICELCSLLINAMEKNVNQFALQNV